LCASSCLPSGLAEQLHAGIAQCATRDGVVRVARCEQHAQLRPHGTCALGEPVPVETAGPDDIGQEQIDVRLPLQQFQRLHAVCGAGDPVAQAAQLRDQMLAHQRIALDDENELGAASWRLHRRRLIMPGRPARPRQIERDTGAAAGRACRPAAD
jgi:hypothetical protein